MHPCGLAEFPGLATTLPRSGNDSKTLCIADGLVSLLFLFLRSPPCPLALQTTQNSSCPSQNQELQEGRGERISKCADVL